MSVLQGASNVTINGGTYTAASNTLGPNFTASNDIVEILHARSATAGLLDASERFDAPKCDEGTRISMIREMRKFVQDGGTASPPALYWLHGPAGVGKSALAQSLSLLLKSEGDHAASFFFSRTSPARSNGNQLMVTLAYQLAISFPALQPSMLSVVKKNPAVLTASNAVQMQSLIIDPINQWQKKYVVGIRQWGHKIFRSKRKIHPRLIFVDGLDECHDPNIQRDLIQCIGLAIREISLPFRFVIASRPESHIMAAFELDPAFQGLGGRKITKNLGDDEGADEQITTFLLREFAEIRRTHPIRDFLPQLWPLPDQIGQLVSKSSKGFIYPATVIRYIKMVNNRPDECLERILGLSEIPIQDKPYEPLDTLYRHIFDSVPEVNKKSIRNIFHFLVTPNYVADIITPRLIEQYHDFKPGHVQHVLRDLLCLVSFTVDAIKVLHASLPDFLLDQSRSGPLFIDVRDAHAAIAATFPLALSNSVGYCLPDFYFINYLPHLIEANVSSAEVQSRLVDVDFKSRYPTLSAVDTFETVPIAGTKEFRRDLEGMTFVAGYLLVLLMQNIRHEDIRRHISEFTTHILQQSHFAASLHATSDQLFSAMVPMFRKWASSVIDQPYMDNLFTFEILEEDFEIREEIFQLYFLMMVPYLDLSNQPEDPDPLCQDQSHSQSQSVCNRVSHILLECILRDNDYDADLRLLAANLLEVSLIHTGYSPYLTAQVNNLLDAGEAPGDTKRHLRRLAPSITDYLERVHPDAPIESQQELVGMKNAWGQYAKKYKFGS